MSETGNASVKNSFVISTASFTMAKTTFSLGRRLRWWEIRQATTTPSPQMPPKDEQNKGLSQRSTRAVHPEKSAEEEEKEGEKGKKGRTHSRYATPHPSKSTRWRSSTQPTAPAS